MYAYFICNTGLLTKTIRYYAGRVGDQVAMKKDAIGILLIRIKLNNNYALTATAIFFSWILALLPLLSRR